MKDSAQKLPSPPEGEGLGERGQAQRRLAFAKQMRHEPTPREHELWQQLRGKRFADHKFRRQHRIGSYIVDFVALSEKVIVELDGGQHDNQRTYDAKRDQFLRANGFEVLRVWNDEWTENRDGVLEKLYLLLTPDTSIHRHPLPNPSPLKGEGLSI